MLEGGSRGLVASSVSPLLCAVVHIRPLVLSTPFPQHRELPSLPKAWIPPAQHNHPPRITLNVWGLFQPEIQTTERDSTSSSWSL